MFRYSLIMPMFYLVVSIIASYKVDRFIVGGGAYPEEFRITFLAILCLLLISVLLYKSIGEVFTYIRNRDWPKFYASIVMVVIGTLFAQMALRFRCKDIAIWVQEIF